MLDVPWENPFSFSPAGGTGLGITKEWNPSPIYSILCETLLLLQPNGFSRIPDLEDDPWVPWWWSAFHGCLLSHMSPRVPLLVQLFPGSSVVAHPRIQHTQEPLLFAPALFSTWSLFCDHIHTSWIKSAGTPAPCHAGCFPLGLLSKS